MFAAVDAAPAGGAAATQVALGTAISLTVVGLIAYLGIGHRSGRIALLRNVGAVAGPLYRMKPWGAVPLVTALGAFLIAGIGFVWDVSIHIDQGRDSGPFGTPAHYLLLLGMYGFVASGFFAIAMADEQDRQPSWVRIREGWHAPPAAIAMLACAVFSMSGFPLDDIWHNIFGQDVTLWGPTHLMMICGGLFNFLALMMVVREARGGRRSFALGVQGAAIVLTGLTVAYQQEFAFGVPQFRLLFQPTLIALSSAVALVGVRMALGRGAAIATALFSGVLLLGLTIIVGPILGESTHHFPLYLVEAAVVELASLKLSGAKLAVASGVLIGTVGTASEWGWTHVWMPIAWPAHVVPEAMARSVVIGVAGALIGAFAATGMRSQLTPRAWVAPAAGLLVAVVSLFSLLPTHATGLKGTLTRAADGRVTVAGVDVKGADWFYAMAWQGGQHSSVATPLERIGRNRYRTRDPLPVGGTWKSFIRFHKGSTMEAVTVHLPLDTAIPAPEVAAPTHATTRPFIGDRTLLQRERKKNVPGWLFSAASASVAAITIALLILLGFVLIRSTSVTRPGRRVGSEHGRAHPSPA